MKTTEELKLFYEGVLLPDINLLEQQRKEVLRKVMIAGVILACIAGSMCLFILKGSLFNEHFGLPLKQMAVPVILCLMIFLGVFAFLTKRYVSGFKQLVIARLVKFVDSGLSYNPQGYISQTIFMMSKIFLTRPNRYKGDDLVSGTIGQTKLQFCEINAKHESGSGKNRRVKKVFKGLFFMGEFNKIFTCRTVVLPDKAEKMLGFIGQKFQSMNISRDELVKLDDPEFEKNFVVYSTDQIGARYILSTSLMKRIVDFKKKTNQDISLAFVGTRVFISVSYDRDLFEPRIFRTLLDFEPVREYFEDLQLAIGIVDDLNLNNRIWTRE
jgi:hypothetical protein